MHNSSIIHTEGENSMRLVKTLCRSPGLSHKLHVCMYGACPDAGVWRCRKAGRPLTNVARYLSLPPKQHFEREPDGVNADCVISVRHLAIWSLILIKREGIGKGHGGLGCGVLGMIDGVWWAQWPRGRPSRVANRDLSVSGPNSFVIQPRRPAKIK